MCESLFKDVKLFNCIEVGASVMGVQYLHAFLYVAKCVLLCAACTLKSSGCIGGFSCVRRIWF